MISQKPKPDEKQYGKHWWWGLPAAAICFWVVWVRAFPELFSTEPSHWLDRALPAITFFVAALLAAAAKWAHHPERIIVLKVLHVLASIALILFMLIYGALAMLTLFVEPMNLLGW